MEGPTDAGRDPGELKQEETGMTGTAEGHEAGEIMRPVDMEIRLGFHLERGTARVGLREP